jgi:hypothetical protein
LGTRHFCAQEGVLEHQFHWWRRTLRERDRRAADEESGCHSSPSTKAGRGAENEAEFLLVRLPFSLETPIEVVHSRGDVIRVPAPFDATVLHRLLLTLDAHDAC